MESVRHPKLLLHQAVQEGLQTPELAGTFTDGLLTRWVLVGELVLPNSHKGLVIVTSTASGEDLPSWDSSGLLAKAMAQELTDRP